MKRNIIVFLFAISFSLISCDLDLTPVSEISEESFYKNSDEINEAVIGCYNGLQTPMVYEWILTELRSDNAQMSIDNSVAVNTEYRELDSHTASPQNSLIGSYWEACYHDIALANQVIQAIDVVDDELLKGQYEGECCFIRAYQYFNLIRLFGPVPLIDKLISGDEAKQIERTGMDIVYQFIESDLGTAVEGLPDSYPSTELGRITSWAARALLAKVYLTQAKYDEASVLFQKIIADSPYSLLTSYADVFDTGNEMNSEILFAVRFMSGSVGLGSPFANWFAPLTSGSNVVNGDGRGYNYPTESLMNSFDSNDSRKEVSFQNSYYDKDKKTDIARAYVNKFMFDVVEPNDAENDWPVIRFADVLLMYSEALNELQGVSAALPFLNQVRERAGLTAYSEADVSGKYQFRMALENERRLEFVFENHRYFDLLRLGRAATVMNEHYQTEAYYNDPQHPEFYVNPIEEWQTVLPIPQREIDINRSLTQNIGY